ncbi:MAG: ribose-5-phosphate isomerase RpiA [Candidatus Poribacteria bacterium]|nr:ribose-5-phosphate isomerase RpiA [Candidatus Poribacteria bacterium]
MDTEQLEKKLKRLAAEHAADEVENEMIVGLGTGSTTYYALLKLGERVRGGLDIIGIPTSQQTAKIATAQGISLSTLREHLEVDVTIDGADEVNPDLDLIKGAGGALVREKIIAYASKRLIIIVDESKLVEDLGSNFSLPVEIVPFGWQATQLALDRICRRSELRYVDKAPFISDNGNYILDCNFDGIPDPAQTERIINNLPGVVENGLFVNRADKVIIGTASGTRIQERRGAA